MLRLAQNKFYVGKTANLENRIAQHKNGAGSSWTKKYKVLDLIESVPDFRFGETCVTLRCMERYGISNVRGSVYSNINLSQRQVEEIQRHIYHENGECLKCGSSEHFIAKCDKKGGVWDSISKLFCCRQSVDTDCYVELEESVNPEDATLVSFGKHMNETYAYVWNNHRDYCKWVMTVESNCKPFLEFKNWCVRQSRA